MKNSYILTALSAVVMLGTSCYDEKMEWGTPEGHTSITADEIPLSGDEKLDRYQSLLTYIPQGFSWGIGMGADMYLNAKKPLYKTIVDNNFNCVTFGNAMKMQSALKANGTLDFTTIDAAVALLPSSMAIWGHNFLWHTQQQNNYLKSVIAPKQNIIPDAGDPMTNVIEDSGFDNATLSSKWSSWSNNTRSLDNTTGANGSSSSMKFIVAGASSAYMWSDQAFYTFTGDLPEGTYICTYWAKTDMPGAKIQFIAQDGDKSVDGNAKYGSTTASLTSDWTQITEEFTIADGVVSLGLERVGLQFGKGAQTDYTIWVDEFKFGVKNASSKVSSSKASITYTPKTEEEKATALNTAMETWIKGMAEHMASVAQGRVIGWDVVNEPINDGNYELRGVDNKNFMDTDAAWKETTTDGLIINWASGHWYWGAFLGKDYAVTAFKLARQYCESSTKLFINEYGLESSTGKLAALIDYVNYIDQTAGSTVVDGIGTQMHIDKSIDTTKITEMFTTLAATGKLIRITELDIALGTASPSAELLSKQQSLYQFVISEYLRIIPAAQQAGICIWGVSDNADEHTYWLPDQCPNLWDANYVRKIAYMGVANGLAGKDVSLDFEYENTVYQETK